MQMDMVRQSGDSSIGGPWKVVMYRGRRIFDILFSFLSSAIKTSVLFDIQPLHEDIVS